MGNLPDLEGERVTPHPDGLAWRKACDVCAHRTCDPQKLGDAYQRRMMEFDGTAAFYCLHRSDANFDRICACYAAMHRFAQIPSPRGTR